MKICSRCSKRKSKKDRSECKICLEYSKNKAKEFRNSQEMKGLCVFCTNKRKSGHTCCEKHLLDIRKKSRKNVINVKNVVLEHYGKRKCAWRGCNVTDLDMLTLDHIKDDGAKERKVFRRTGVILFAHLIKNKFPKGYQVLCANHNLKKELMRRREKYAGTS